MSNPYQHLTEEERIQRIAELLLLAVQRSCSAAPVANPVTAAPSEAVDPGSSADETDGKVLRYLHQFGGAAPKQIRAGLGIPSSTLCRSLARLRERGRVRAFGRTRAAWYEIAPSDNGGKWPSTVRRGVVKR